MDSEDLLPPVLLPQRPGNPDNWENYILFQTAVAKDMPQYFILRYIIARPVKGPAEACTLEGFKKIEGKISYTSRTCFLGLN